MLQSVSWATFFKAVLLSYCTYYAAIAFLLYRAKLGTFIQRLKQLLVLLPLMLLHAVIYAQTADGNSGLNQANTLIRSYFDTGVQILYAVGALVALIGAGMIYGHWNTHSQKELAREAAVWFGGCIFLVIVATVIKSFFGL